MKKGELLVFFNTSLKEKNLPYEEIKGWAEIQALDDRTLKRIFDSFADLLAVEGIGQDGEINQLGLIYESICDIFNHEIIKRNDFNRKH